MSESSAARGDGEDQLPGGRRLSLVRSSEAPAVEDEVLPEVTDYLRHTREVVSQSEIPIREATEQRGLGRFLLGLLVIGCGFGVLFAVLPAHPFIQVPLGSCAVVVLAGAGWYYWAVSR